MASNENYIDAKADDAVNISTLLSGRLVSDCVDSDIDRPSKQANRIKTGECRYREMPLEVASR